MSSSPASAALDLRVRANRANAQPSTGPRTEEGKAVSCLKTALAGRNALLPTNDAAAYEQHIEAYEHEFELRSVPEISSSKASPSALLRETAISLRATG